MHNNAQHYTTLHNTAQYTAQLLHNTAQYTAQYTAQ